MNTGSELLTLDSQWAVIEPLFPRAGNKSKWEKRELADAVLYLVDNGRKWRNIPHDFPPFTTVTNFYYAAIKSGLWEKIRAALVEKARIAAGRNAGPSCAVIDPQSVKTTAAAEERGFDGGKTKGRKRHIVVVVHAANIHDTKSGIPPVKEAYEKYPTIQRFCADAGYRKTFERDISQELEAAFIGGGCWMSEGFSRRSRQIFEGGLTPGKKI